ncbi:S9 family peptidase [Brachybacterium sp. EF45031]|uniref:prolyl oligopeptidase family serine peptidase n=1 Tax=Brachybacterium sillae TaxID=2810536 RepID=UPI00217EC788|nr:prolyl oligopeptidase family serine peptidase [Brachybacterium sillae]MCS6711403.1 S9 family peptidase [Brachybacterium sillae]
MTTEPRLPAPDGSDDPWLFLEDVTGDEALAWVRERNAETEQELDALPLTATLQQEIREILDAPDRIPGVTLRGEHVYNLWTDAGHERGLWRRTTLEDYRRDQPDWEVLLDVDALGREEQESWVWHGARLLRPAEGEPYRRALVTLSRGGSDADVTREFDLESRRFVAPPAEAGEGFVRPEAKGSVSWVDADTVLVCTEVGEGSTTTSGYPRQARLWRRGQDLAEAQIVFEGARDDMGIWASHDSTPGYERDWVIQAHAFYDTTLHLLDRSTEPPTTTALPVPRDMEAGAHRDLAILTPRSDWTVGEETFPAGSVVVGDLDALLAGEPRLHLLFAPTERSSLAGMALTRGTVVLSILEDVVHRLEVHHRTADGQWQSRDLFPELRGTLEVAAVDSDHDDRLWLTVTDFVEPTRLLLADLAPVLDGEDPEEPQLVKAAPARFDATGVEVTQHFATSADGTRVPYFEVGAADGSGDDAAPRPTLLYGYGGFEISLTPSYLGPIGKAWVERGGTYVLANIRGGGEYGPRWHQAALKENRPRAYEDFEAVARDLVERGVTDTAHLAVRGGSNGGLLTGNMLTRSPELFGAVVIQVPLLDMKRYSHLLAGASWMAEYGDPDTDDWEFLQTFSPYHRLREGVTYPPTLVLTSTRDDRVHPGHARKFTAALRSLGADVRSWENIEGGHGGAATTEQASRMHALMYSFLWATLGGDTR